MTLIREYTNNGSRISDAQNADYILSRNRLADMAQKRISTVKKIPAIHYISNNPIPNQLGLLSGFETWTHLDIDRTIEAVGSKAYYFEVDNVATIYIEEQISSVWTLLTTINNTVKGKYTAYKGLITASSVSNRIRVRFSGSFVYNIRNRALYAYSFPLAADVPQYLPFVRNTLPSDFYQLDKIVQTGENRQYTNFTDYRWEPPRTLRINFYQIGEIQAHYFRYPTTITALTPETYEFEVDVEAQELIPLYIGAKVLMDENITIATSLINEFEVELSRLSGNTEAVNFQQIQNVYGV